MEAVNKNEIHENFEINVKVKISVDWLALTLILYKIT